MVTAGKGSLEVITTPQGRCRLCFACVRHCPVKAIKVDGQQALVQAERCIFCGRCVQMCTQGAKAVETEVDRVSELVSSGRPVVAMLAPEVVAAFHPVRVPQLECGLVGLGFYSVEDTLLADELLAREYARLFSERRDEPVIRSTCPTTVRWLQVYYPEFLHYLAPLVSPMVLQGRLVKATYEADVATVFVTPCIAAKAEARDPAVAGAIDAVLTFPELRELFERAGVDVAALPDSDFERVRPVLLRQASLSGGFPRSVCAAHTLLDSEIRVLRGIGEIDSLARACSRGEVRPKLVDVMNCEGCIDGPAMVGEMSVFARKNVVAEAARESQRGASRTVSFDQLVLRLPWVETMRNFEAREIERPLPSEVEMQAILAAADKHDKLDQLDCGACGYDSCREKAIAIYQGMAQWEMCFPFQKKLFLRAVEQLKAASLTDALTGLPNHRAFLERLDTELKRAQRYRSQLSLLMIDVDRFKEINDGLGHVRGDELLRSLGRTFLQNLRDADFAARYGGDEFVILLPETDKTHAFAVAEKLRKEIEDAPQLLNSHPTPVTVSLGISSVTPEVTEPDRLVERADAAMYRAKEQGRNRTYIAPDLV